MRLLTIMLCITCIVNPALGQEISDIPAPLMLPSERQTPIELPDDVISLRQLAGQFYYSGNPTEFVRVMEKLSELRPNNGEYMYQLTIAYALSNQSSKAYNKMLTMQQQGLSYDFTKTEDVENIRNTQVFEYLSDLMIRAGEPMGAGSIAFSLPQDFVLPEAMDWDPNREMFIIGNVDDGRVLLVDRSGTVKTFIQSDAENGPWGIFDLKIDAERSLLWASSSAGSAYRLASEETRNKTGLFKIDLKTGKLLGTYLVTNTDKRRSALANIAVASDGTVYVADSLRPAIYKLEAGSDTLIPAFASTELISIRGLALSDDDKTLYLADYELGLLVLRLEEKQAMVLGTPVNLNVGGIDGLYLWDNHLITIQNGISPQRVMRLELDPAGLNVANVRPLEVAHPSFDAPNYGTIVGDDLYYFANSQWHKIGQDGKLIDKRPVSVLRTSLLGEANLQSPEMEEIMHRIREQQKVLEARPGLLDVQAEKEGN